MQLRAKKLTAEAFASYGQVIAAPAPGERFYFGETIRNLRPEARLGLSQTAIAGGPLPCKLRLFERHEFSAQAFLPMPGTRYLVVVCPDTGQGKPDTARAQAFKAGWDQGVVYAPGCWHHPMTVLSALGRFTVVMWDAGDGRDEELIPLDHEIEVR